MNSEIAETAALDRDATVARIVTAHPTAARVFQKRGIDYCCHGDVSVAEACARAGLDPATVWAELESVLAGGEARPEANPAALSNATLIAQIIDVHHGYLRTALPAIAPIMSKVARVHGPKDAGLQEVEAAFQSLSASLAPHLDDEEEVLFPLLMSRRPDPVAVRDQLAGMLVEHRAVGTLLARIRELTHAFAIPEWGCNTYRVLMAELEALEADILRHVHLENHVLAPRFEEIARAA